MSRLYPGVHAHELNSNFESYMSKLLKKKGDKPRPITRERTSRTSNPVQISRLPNQKSVVVPYIKTDDKYLLQQSDEEDLIHKEVINNKMAQVEVTVRTVSAKSRSRSNSVCTEKREPWAKLLQRKSNELIGYNYDYGLGTIHYLSKELQQKLQMACPGDPSLQQIVNDIQHTLYRINPSISGKSDDENVIYPKDQCGDTNLNSKLRKENAEKGPSKPTRVNQSMQTIRIGDSEKNIKKLYEHEPKHINSRKEIEQTISKVQIEKQELEKQLQVEKDMVKKLKKDMDEQLSEKNDKSGKIIKQLSDERDALLQQLREKEKELKLVDIQELTNSVQKLQNDNANSEYETLNLKHEVTIMKLEKEKMSYLLESRDKQIKALRHEIEAIQSLVCSQLFDLKTCCYSPTISRSSIESKHWRPAAKVGNFKPINDIYLNKVKSGYTYVPETPSSTDVNENGMCKKETATSFKTNYQDEYPQRDIPPSKGLIKNAEEPKSLSELTGMTELQELIKDDLEMNIKEMFEELKRQALVVTLASPTSDQLKDTRSVDTHLS